jgi:hypothetical protein
MPKNWGEEATEFKTAGFSDEEIGQEEVRVRREMSDAGFAGKEIDEYFGIKEPDMSKTKTYLENNLKNWRPPMAPPKDGIQPAQTNGVTPVSAKEGGAPAVGAGPREAHSIIDALEAGWQMSVTGLLPSKASLGLGRGKAPDIVLPEHADMFYRIASQVGTLAGDVPAMVAGSFGGGVAGGAAGSIVPVVGNVAGAAIGAGAGAFALPEAVRTTLMQHYEKGDIKDFGDFWERSSVVFLNSLKAGAIGGVTAGAGGVAGKVLAPVASTAAKTTAIAASEVATMVTVGKAIEGEVPKFEDFGEAALLVGAMHGSTHVAGKLRNLYAKTGIKPAEIALQAQTDPILKQQLLAKNDVQPSSAIELQPKAEEAAPKTEVEAGPKPESQEAPISEAAQKIRSQIAEQPEVEGKTLPSGRELYKDFVDKFDPINEAVKVLKENPETLPADQHPYLLTRGANDAKAKVKHIFEKGMIDYKTLSKTGKSMNEIVDPFLKNKDFENLRDYWISKRVLEVEGRGIKSGFDVEAAKTVVEAGRGKYDQAVNDLVEFANGGLRYIRDAGVISKEQYARMEQAGASYAPLTRIMEEGGGGPKGKKPKNIKSLEGSERKVQDPFVSLLQNMESMVKVAERNRAVDSFIRLAEETPGQKLIEKVGEKAESVKLSAEDLAKLKDHGVEAADAAPLSQAKQAPAKGTIEVYRDGKREVYKVAKDAPIGLAEAFEKLDGDPGGTNVLFRIAKGLTAVKKIGISIMPDFMIKNVIRDQVTSGVFSKGGTLPFTDIVSAMGDLLAAKSSKAAKLFGKTDEAYYNWLKSGGANGTFLELGQQYLEKDIFKLDKETGFIESAHNVVKAPVEFLKMAGELTEQASRLAEFKRVSKGETSGSKLFEGGYAAREVTVDFSRIGAKMSAVNAITAFMNVSIQGLDRTARAVKEDPTGVATKAGMYITLPSILLWWANKDDPRWKEIPRWQKDMFWIVMTKDTVYRIPKPQELGVLFGSVPERVLEKFLTDNPNAMKNLDDTMMDLVTPAFMPDAVSPAIEHMLNKSFFTSKPVIPHQFENLLPEDQYTEYTTESAKVMGKMIQALPSMRESSMASPMVIENYVRAWTGPMGAYIMKTADRFLTAAGVVPDPVRPEDTLADLPVVKAFAIRYPSSGAQSIQDFYEAYSRSSKYLNSLQTRAKGGDIEGAQKIINENADKIVKLDMTKNALTEMSKTARMIQKMNVSPREKRQLIDGVYYQMIAVSQAANQVMTEVEKSMKSVAK